MRDLELQARMKTALKQGGHVFAHRGAGKTRTIVELMKEDYRQSELMKLFSKIWR